MTNNNTMELNIFTDPGHGWCAIERDVLRDLGILDHVSNYSYQRGTIVYLEEDCDLSLLVRALQAKGVTPAFTEKHTDYDSPIRQYSAFSA